MAEVKGEQLTLARVHAVLAALSVAMIVQLTSVNPVTESIRQAVNYLAAAALLNLVCYVLEADRTIPQIKSLRQVTPVIVLYASTFFTALYGVGCVIMHFSQIAGIVFTLSAVALVYAYAYRLRLSLLVIAQRAKSQRAEYDSIKRQLNEGGPSSEIEERIRQLDRRWDEFRLESDKVWELPRLLRPPTKNPHRFPEAS